MKVFKPITQFIMMSFFAFSAANAAENTHWGYLEGSFSADKWGDLSHEFVLCKAGKNQSPINIDNTVKGELAPLKFHYDITDEDIVYNGHSVQINLHSKDDYIIIDDDRFYLQQFHFHTPSENKIKGKSYPLEVHFVHSNENGETAVVAAMFEIGDFNEELAKAWSALTKEENKTNHINDPIDIYALLPKNKSYYRFSGSLTTPPCSEGVIWLVFKDPITLSKEQYNKIKSVITFNNNRPLQSKHGRIIIE